MAIVAKRQVGPRAKIVRRSPLNWTINKETMQAAEERNGNFDAGFVEQARRIHSGLGSEGPVEAAFQRLARTGTYGQNGRMAPATIWRAPTLWRLLENRFSFQEIREKD